VPPLFTDSPRVDVRRLGRRPYGEADALQRRVHEAVVAGRSPSTLLVLEHEPVITVSRRRGAAGHVRADRRTLARHGIEVAETDRGGDVTYHGPGQLVVWPIVRLADYRLNVGRYLRLLEEAVIEAVAGFGVTAHRDPAPGLTGVWVAPAGAGPAAKLCAMGVRVRRGVSLHGLALNVRTDLAHFAHIVPCGLADRPVTSLEALLGRRAPTLEAAGERVSEVLACRFRCRFRALASEAGRDGAGVEA